MDMLIEINLHLFSQRTVKHWNDTQVLPALPHSLPCMVSTAVYVIDCQLLNFPPRAVSPEGTYYYKTHPVPPCLAVSENSHGILIFKTLKISKPNVTEYGLFWSISHMYGESESWCLPVPFGGI